MFTQQLLLIFLVSYLAFITSLYEMLTERSVPIYYIEGFLTKEIVPREIEGHLCLKLIITHLRENNRRISRMLLRYHKCPWG